MLAHSVLSLGLHLAACAIPRIRGGPSPWLVLAGVALLYGGLVLTWRWLSRRWGLSGAGAPRKADLQHHEYLARRSLRALLAFDFLVILPIGLPASAVALTTALANPRGMEPGMLTGALGLLIFILPVPALRRSIRRMEQQRLAGQTVQPEPRPNTSGLAELDEHLRGAAWGTRLAAAVIACASVAAWAVPEHRLASILFKDNDAILSGQVWRLLTVAFVHGSPMHLLFNVSVLLSAGSLFERLAGTRRQLLVLIAGTVAGSVSSVALVPFPSVGASGGVLAVAAAVVAFGLRNRALFPSSARSRLFRASVELVALNGVLTFVLPNVDWAAHVGGLLAGAALGWLTLPSQGTVAALVPPNHRGLLTAPESSPQLPPMSG